MKLANLGKNVSFICKYVNKANYSFTSQRLQDVKDSNFNLPNEISQKLALKQTDQKQDTKANSWFEKLTTKTNATEKIEFTSMASSNYPKTFQLLSKEEKKVLIQKLLKEQYEEIPQNVIDKNWDRLENSTSYNKLSKLVK